MGPMDNGGTGDIGYRGMGNGVQGYGAYAHVPHWPCDLLPMWRIPLVPHTPCAAIAHVAHTLYPIPAVGLIGHVPHIPCTPLSSVSTLPIGPVAHVAHYPMGGGQGYGAHGAIVYRG